MPEIRHLVIDEADRMVEKGHFEEMTKILNLINELVQRKFSKIYNNLIIIILLKIQKWHNRNYIIQVLVLLII